MRIPRTRGAVSGLMVVLLGAFGALVPFVGPSFNFTIGPDSSFDMTAGRFWLSLLPGVVAVVGGLVLLLSANRATAVLGAQVAIAAGVWFVVGPTLSVLWSDAAPPLGQAGRPLGGEYRQMAELLAYFYGLGAAITAFAALALGRMTLRTVRDVELERERAVARRDTGVATPRRRRFVRGRNGDRDRDRVEEPTAVTTTNDR
ncbi:MAG TPA: hypothetical protein VGJ32_12365 [Solirubrobacteraceae bacterium]|jgi:hypothetical protein